MQVEPIAVAVRERVFQHGITEAKALEQQLDAAFEEALFTAQDEASLESSVANALNTTGEIDDLVRDAAIEEIWVNPNGRVFVSEGGRTRFSGRVLAQKKVELLAETLVRPSARRLDRLNPFVDCSLDDGSRVHIIGNGLTSHGYAINIRKFPDRILTLDDLVESSSVSKHSALVMRNLVASGKNLIISGGTNSGKTTLLCALLNELPKNTRLVSIEDTFEIRYRGVDWVQLQARSANAEGMGEITIRQLVKEALRMRPDRLVVGEVRAAEALDLLLALNSGIPGMGTIHSHSARGAIQKLCSLPLLAGANISDAFVRPTVAESIHTVIHCGIDAAGRRQIRQIAELNLSTEREIELHDALA
ncbi:MAG: hypothetical protein RIR16_279 [Actinomycetota bacterium]|jgi:pilus assembly protein CpaF